MIQFLINKNNITNFQLSESTSVELENGEVRIAVSEFAFTANNITYGLLGEKFSYWKFFPAANGFGIIPAWGIGQVLSSNHEEVKVGERLYGYYPMANELVIKPSNISNYGMVDTSPHRLELPAVYNYYERIISNPILKKELEHVYMLFNPLFGTSFLLSLFFKDEAFFDAKSIILTSASSKTAIALAYALKHSADINVVGITSKKNLDFVEKLEVYDQVICYEETSNLERKSSVIVDFAGNKGFLLSLQNSLGSHLKYCSAVGLSHWDKQSEKVDFPLKPVLFFAPSYGAQKIGEWGMQLYKQKLNELMLPFLKWTRDWIQIVRISKVEVPETYTSVLAGRMNPKKGLIINF